MEVGKIQPNDVEAEQAVLGSMLLDKDAVTNAIEILKSEDFYREENKLIFSAMVSLYARSEPIDIITVKDELVSLGKLDVCGGIEFLAELSDKVPTTANVDNYIKIVEEKAVLRSLIKTSNELIDLGYDQTYTAEEIVEKAEKSIFDLSKNRNKKGFAHIKEVLFETFEQIEKLYNQKEAITGIPTGFIDLDSKTAGLHGSELILVAIFSLEMSKEQLVQRILASETMIDSNKLRTGKVEEEDLMSLPEKIRSTIRIRNIYR